MAAFRGSAPFKEKGGGIILDTTQFDYFVALSKHVLSCAPARALN
jgi:hypothetical protein